MLGRREVGVSGHFRRLTLKSWKGSAALVRGKQQRSNGRLIHCDAQFVWVFGVFVFCFLNLFGEFMNYRGGNSGDTAWVDTVS